MKNLQRGFFLLLLIAIIALVVIGVRLYIYTHGTFSVDKSVDINKNASSGVQTIVATTTPIHIASSSQSNNETGWPTFSSSHFGISLNLPNTPYISTEPREYSLTDYYSDFAIAHGLDLYVALKGSENYTEAMTSNVNTFYQQPISNHYSNLTEGSVITGSTLGELISYTASDNLGHPNASSTGQINYYVFYEQDSLDGVTVLMVYKQEYNQDYLSPAIFSKIISTFKFTLPDGHTYPGQGGLPGIFGGPSGN